MKQIRLQDKDMIASLLEEHEKMREPRYLFNKYKTTLNKFLAEGRNYTEASSIALLLMVFPYQNTEVFADEDECLYYIESMKNEIYEFESKVM